MSPEGSLDVAKARSFFPSLSSKTPYIFADNAGGSQCSRPVIYRIVDYLSNTNVQLGADYSVSKTSADRVDLGTETARVLFNASNGDEIALGSSSTLLLENLARAIEGDLGDEDEVIVTGEHEGRSVDFALHSTGELNDTRSEYWTMEEARDAERAGA